MTLKDSRALIDERKNGNKLCRGARDVSIWGNIDDFIVVIARLSDRRKLLSQISTKRWKMDGAHSPSTADTRPSLHPQIAAIIKSSFIFIFRVFFAERRFKIVISKKHMPTAFALLIFRRQQTVGGEGKRKVSSFVVLLPLSRHLTRLSHHPSPFRDSEGRRKVCQSDKNSFTQFLSFEDTRTLSILHLSLALSRSLRRSNLGCNLRNNTPQPSFSDWWINLSSTLTQHALKRGVNNELECFMCVCVCVSAQKIVL
jgi:hypothetical protein